MYLFRILAMLLLMATAPATAMPDHLSKPAYVAPESSIPEARDIPYPGEMKLLVDARDNRQGIFRVTQTIPVPGPGQFTLLFPEWLPGNHAPRGEIEKLTGLVIEGGGQKLEWLRDDVDINAFHVDIPGGVSEIIARFQFTSPTVSNQGRIVMAPAMLNLRWHNVSLYPAGYYVRQIPVQATAIYPDGWQSATSLRRERTEGNMVVYESTDYGTLVDSPVFAGEHFRSIELTPEAWLHVMADDPKYLKPKRSHIEKHRKLVREAEKLFGSRPYDRYDFLLALSEEMGGIGIEHHRSSENAVHRQYFTGWDAGPGRRNLLPHEIVHVWIGKYKRPRGMWTPEFRTPMRDRMLWVYEGQTQFWGYVLGARSGLYSKQDTLDAFAAIAADMENRVGRRWRPLIDTTHDPIIAARKPKPWTSWQRAEDYYNEGLLVWLEIDQIIRNETGGRRSLENFARRFFDGRDGDWGVQLFDKADVIETLNQVHEYDWAGFIDRRIYQTSSEAPKDGLFIGGYQLVFVDEPSAFVRSNERRRKIINLSYSIGLTVGSKGTIASVVWDSPAFRAGLKSGLTITAVNGKAYSAEILKQEIADNKGSGRPIEIFAKSGDQYHNFMIDHDGGLLYPKLEKIPGKGAESPGGIDRLLEPLTR